MEITEQAVASPAPEPAGSGDLQAQARAFARMTPAAKATLFRSALPRLRELAPKIVEASCRARGVDPLTAAAGEEGLASPGVLLAHPRVAAEPLDEIARSGRPEIAESALSVSSDRVVARLMPGG